MTQAVLFTALIPLALIAVLGLVFLSGRLSATARDRIERLLVLIIYPGLAAWWGWQAWASARSHDWLVAGAFAVAAACMAVQAGLLVRRRGLPWSSGKAA